MISPRRSEQTDLQAVALPALHKVLDEAISYDGRALRHYEDVPDTAQLPYLTSGPSDAVPAQIQTSGGYGGAQTVTIQLDTWSGYTGKKEVREVQRLAVEHVTTTPWPLDGGYTATRKRVLTPRIISDPGPNVTHHGIAEIQLRIQRPTP